MRYLSVGKVKIAMTTTGKRRSAGVFAQEITGQAQGAEPATPGSYGLAPSGFRLPEETRLGAVCLQVAELDRSLKYYESVLGLQLLAREEPWARLGTPSNTVLVELREHKGARISALRSISTGRGPAGGESVASS